MTLFTIGYEGRSLDELIAELTGAGVERPVDARELPLSRRRGFSKTALSEALRGAHIEYVHLGRSATRSRTESATGPASRAVLRLPLSSAAPEFLAHGAGLLDVAREVAS